ncbi:MAG TPA: beta-ketoacyl synthase chain length factor [Gallionella sp.]|nr:beta-ketoacyl synthase chain length factor [Gallionella sp.]
MKIFIEGVGVLGPGLCGWQASQAILAGTAAYIDAALVIPPIDLLPSAERRRTGPAVKIALAAGCEAVAHAQRNASELPSVFASSAGEGENMQAIFEALAADGREISPTRFHNSVHNAPSGYWSIATKSMAPSISLACYDDSFVAGLLEAGAQAYTGGDAVVLMSYDTPYTHPVHDARPISAGFGIGLVLTGNKTDRSLSGLEISISRNNGASTPIANPQLEAMRLGIPAARSLPLLAALAAHTQKQVCINYVAGNQVNIVVQPC